MEYYTRLNTKNVFSKPMYTSEKKEALIKAMTQRGSSISKSLERLQNVSLFLEEKGTADVLKYKEDLNIVISRLKYEAELTHAFKEELNS